ncbi:MAG: zinc-binding alcohol dehydrogenase, partial [Promethearchaeota archaeon CR_4]
SSLEEVDRPSITSTELLVQVHACGVCHTDLHVVEGELPHTKLPIIPGHEIVGKIVELGEKTKKLTKGDRVGIFWLHHADGTCRFCKQGLENLCDNAIFTGYTTNGGYADYVTIPAEFAIPLPMEYSDVDAAPLLCAGVVGYRALRLADVRPGELLGIFGFGASGHLCIQVARYWGCEVYVFTRGAEHQQQARQLGATWVGLATDTPPSKLDRAIIFAPVGTIVPQALGHLRKGGTLCINAIRMSGIPSMQYSLLWGERTIRTVANANRRDAKEFLQLAPKIPLKVSSRCFPLEQANLALNLLKRGEIQGAAVLKM